MGNGFAFARWVTLAYPYMSSEGDKPIFYACARDEWKHMQHPQHKPEQP